MVILDELTPEEMELHKEKVQSLLDQGFRVVKEYQISSSPVYHMEKSFGSSTPIEAPYSWRYSRR